MPNGSYMQRVQAEFLKEIEGRAKAAFGGERGSPPDAAAVDAA